MFFYKYGFKSYFEILMVFGIFRFNCIKDCLIDMNFFIKWFFNEIDGYFLYWYFKCIK